MTKTILSKSFANKRHIFFIKNSPNPNFNISCLSVKDKFPKYKTISKLSQISKSLVTAVVRSVILYTLFILQYISLL